MIGWHLKSTTNNKSWDNALVEWGLGPGLYNFYKYIYELKNSPIVHNTTLTSNNWEPIDITLNPQPTLNSIKAYWIKIESALDTTPPAPPIITSSALTKQATPTITGTAEAGSTVTAVIAGATYIKTATGGNWSVNTNIDSYSGTLALDINGINSVLVTATDAVGNTSNPVTQTLVIDTTAPTITITGANPLTHEKGTAYTDPGATTNDGSVVTAVSTVNINILDAYIVTYNATDTAGNAATPQVRTVNVTESRVDIYPVNYNFEDVPGGTLNSGNFSQDFTPPSWTDEYAPNSTLMRIIEKGAVTYLAGTGNPADNHMIGFRHGRRLSQDVDLSAGSYECHLDGVIRTMYGTGGGNDAAGDGPGVQMNIKIDNLVICSEIVNNTTIEPRVYPFTLTESKTYTLEISNSDNNEETFFIDNIYFKAT